VPHASWLRRSEIERFTVNLLSATEGAPRRRQSNLPGSLKNALCRIARNATYGRRCGGDGQ
jgi:hypothetical protein